jgi:hypothetical protein
MDEKLQNKLLDAGILPQNAVKQMEQWQSVPEGSAAKVGEFSEEKIAKLREEMELQELPTLKETVLDVDKYMKEGREVRLSHSGLGITGVIAGVDALKRYIFAIPRDRKEYDLVSVFMRPLTRLEDGSLEPPLNQRVVTAVSVLYATVEKGASVPTHWFCETAADGESLVRAR